MEPILKSHFVKFKSDYEIVTGDDVQKEASAFERFVNYVLFSLDYPDVFTADAELLEFVSVGGSDDIFIDGIGITINDRLVRSRLPSRDPSAKRLHASSTPPDYRFT